LPIATGLVSPLGQDLLSDAPNLTPIEYASLYDSYVALKGQNWIFWTE
jgi:hypothetical protein